MLHAQRTQILDPGAIFTAMTDLAADADTVVLHAVDASNEYRFFVHAVDASTQRVTLVSEPGMAPPFEAGSKLILNARRRAGYLSSTAMHCDLVTRDADQGVMSVRCRMPGELLLRHARGDWRAQLLADEMFVVSKITRPEGQQLCGLLIDLSVGGCRIELRPAPYRVPAIGARVPVMLEFPSGETAELEADVRQIEKSDEAIRLGLAFVDVPAELSRRLWFYTCEIDREVVRRTRPAGELHRLAPSRLFIDPAELSRARQDEQSSTPRD